MEPQLGRRYHRPIDAPDSWPCEVLEQIRAQRVGDVAIELESSAGGVVRASLEQVEHRSTGAPALVLEGADGRSTTVRCDYVRSFTLLDEPPPDHSDELRGL